MKGIWQRLFGDRQPETRSHPSWAAVAGHSADMPHSGGHYAENLTAVLASVEAIGTAMASLPAFVQRRDGDRLETAPEHPVSRLIELGPNDHQSWPDWVHWTMAQALMHGNALSEIVTDGRGAPAGLRPIPWNHVSVQMLPSRRLAFDFADPEDTIGGAGRERRLFEDEVFHLKDRTDHGLVGVSRLARAAQPIAAADKTQRFAHGMYANNAALGGVLKHPGRLSAEAAERVRHSFEARHKGPENAGRMAVLEEGMDYAATNMSAEAAQLIDSRRFSIEEIARIFGVPPPIIGDLSNGTFTNTETVGRWFATNTLSPWIRKAEHEFRRSVFPESSRATHRLTFDLSGFLRGDPEQRWQAHQIAVRNQILTPNEVRRVEGWNPRDGGDRVVDPGATANEGA